MVPNSTFWILGAAINLGAAEYVKVIRAARGILRGKDRDMRIGRHSEMLTGSYNRLADNSLAKKRLGSSYLASRRRNPL